MHIDRYQIIEKGVRRVVTRRQKLETEEEEEERASTHCALMQARKETDAPPFAA